MIVSDYMLMLSKKVEELFVHGDLNQAINILDELNEKFRLFHWEMEKSGFAHTPLEKNIVP